MTEYEEFIDKYFPKTQKNFLYNDIYRIVCKNNVLFDIYFKYSNIKKDTNEEFFLKRYMWGINKILLYIPLNDGIGINACIRYSVEQLLKFLYSVCFEKTINKINKTSYRHIKEEMLLRESSFRIEQESLEYLYTYYAKYSNDVHDKVNFFKEITFLEEILNDKNTFIKQVYNDVTNITKQFDIIMIHLYQISIDKLTLGEKHRVQRLLSHKQYERVFSLMEKEIY